ncbi:MAG: pantoate--beta-alanine ligase [Rhodospirillales bacterium 20-60-12]|nr:MAG: pantoate--beta-alanine ligase [Rhodospirillales bacterium 20-60-12]HQT66394.1 pantoate--beta-alanine ligase [Acetobacteraceae bacterium]
MEIVRTIEALVRTRARFGGLALVPTMGALHNGHMALMAAARTSGFAVAASIFVNPLQFGPAEDLARYPRDEAGDLAKLEAAGCDLAWLPDQSEMYPPGDASVITVAGPATRWEGAMRPGHFAGVATVVAKLFGQVRPRCALFGEKDWQQIQVIKRMTTDLLLPVEIVAVPTVREADGLALSSRNRFLTAPDRAAAPQLHKIMTICARAIESGAPPDDALDQARIHLNKVGMSPDYFVLVDPATLEPAQNSASEMRLLAAARLGSVRLLDNISVKPYKAT